MWLFKRKRLKYKYKPITLKVQHKSKILSLSLFSIPLFQLIVVFVGLTGMLLTKKVQEKMFHRGKKYYHSNMSLLYHKSNIKRQLVL